MSRNDSHICPPLSTSAPLQIAVFLEPQYSLASLAIAIHRVNEVARRGGVKPPHWRFFSDKQAPTPAECANWIPQNVANICAVACDLAIIARSCERNVPRSELTEEGLRSVGVRWRSVVELPRFIDRMQPCIGEVGGEGGWNAALARVFAPGAYGPSDMPKRARSSRHELGFDPFALFRLVASEASPLVRQAIQLMVANVESPLQINELASRLGVDTRRLLRQFTVTLGEGPLEVYRRIRLEHARLLIEREPTAITDIALKCGFADGPHFARSFRTHFQSTPAAHRKRIQGSGTVTARTAPEVRLTIGAIENHTYHWCDTFAEWGRRVRAQSGGRIQFTPTGHTLLGLRSSELVEAVADGRLDAALLVPEACGPDSPMVGLTPQATLCESARNELIKEAQRSAVERLLKRRGLAVLARVTDSLCHRFWLFSREPINNLQQLRKMRLAHWSAIGASAFEHIGVQTQIVKYSGLRRMFENRMVDAAFCIPRFAQAERLWDVTGYMAPAMAVTRNYPYVVVVRKQTLQSIPAELSDVIRNVADHMYFEGAIEGQADPSYIQSLETGGLKGLPKVDQSDLESIESSMLHAWKERCSRMDTVVRDSCSSILRALS